MQGAEGVRGLNGNGKNIIKKFLKRIRVWWGVRGTGKSQQTIQELSGTMRKTNIKIISLPAGERRRMYI